MKHEILIPSKYTYLGEVKQYYLDGAKVDAQFSLPTGILNKTITGCGGTTLALTNNENVVICSPRNALLINKAKQYKETILLNGKTSDADLKAYFASHSVYKVLCTFDSFRRLAPYIQNDWHIVVDEFQCILNDASFKSEIEMRFLGELSQYNNITYLSATPMLDVFINEIDELASLPYYVIKWENAQKVNIIRKKCARPINALCDIIETYKAANYPHIKVNNETIYSKEAVFFVNSVSDILNIIKTCKLQPQDVNLIISDTNKTRLPKGFEIGDAPLKGEVHKQFTFCTSTAYFGVDFYSTNASTYVVSDTNKQNTVLDISSELVQIVGRQRLAENPFKNYVHFIFNTNRETLNEEEFNALLERKMKDTFLDIEAFNNADEQRKTTLANRCKSNMKILKYADSYTYFDGNKLAFNKLAKLNDIFSYKTQKDNYTNGLFVRRSIEACEQLALCGN